MKKITALLLAFVMIVGFTACSSGGAEKTVDEFLKAMQNANYADADQHLTEAAMEQMFEEVDSIGGLEKIVFDALRNFKYQIDEVDQVTESQTAVNLTMEITDFGTILQELFASVLSKSLAGTELSDEELEESMETELAEIIADKDRELLSIEVKVLVDKVDGAWRIDIDKNLELLNALFGNLPALMGGLGF